MFGVYFTFFFFTNKLSLLSTFLSLLYHFVVSRYYPGPENNKTPSSFWWNANENAWDDRKATLRRVQRECGLTSCDPFPPLDIFSFLQLDRNADICFCAVWLHFLWTLCVWDGYREHQEGRGQKCRWVDSIIQVQNVLQLNQWEQCVSSLLYQWLWNTEWGKMRLH